MLFINYTINNFTRKILLMSNNIFANQKTINSVEGLRKPRYSFSVVFHIPREKFINIGLKVPGIGTFSSKFPPLFVLWGICEKPNLLFFSKLFLPPAIFQKSYIGYSYFSKTAEKIGQKNKKPFLKILAWGMFQCRFQPEVWIQVWV